jgi:hypothetical protein
MINQTSGEHSGPWADVSNETDSLLCLWEPGGRPPRDPLRRPAAWESDFSGMVCEIPRRLGYQRMRLLLYALHAATLPGLRRGRPTGRGPRILSNTASNCVQSTRWPSVMSSESGRQRPSALRWILAVNRRVSGRALRRLHHLRQAVAQAQPGCFARQFAACVPLEPVRAARYGRRRRADGRAR